MLKLLQCPPHEAGKCCKFCPCGDLCNNDDCLCGCHKPITDKCIQCGEYHFLEVDKPVNFDHYTFKNEAEQKKYYQGISDGIEMGSRTLTPRHIEDKYLILHGWGFNLYLEFNSIGCITGFLDDTSGG